MYLSLEQILAVQVLPVTGITLQAIAVHHFYNYSSYFRVQTELEP
jgi:hypothetical protein